MKTPEQRLAEIREIIEDADARAANVDGPVSHVRDTMTNVEWRRLYRLTVMPKPRAPKFANTSASFCGGGSS